MLSRNNKSYKQVAQLKFEIAHWTMTVSGWSEDLDPIIASQLHAYVMGGVFGALSEDVEYKTI